LVVLIALADYFNVTLDYLTGRQADDFTPLRAPPPRRID